MSQAWGEEEDVAQQRRERVSMWEILKILCVQGRSCRWVICKHILSLLCVPMILALGLVLWYSQDMELTWEEAIAYGRVDIVQWMVEMEGYSVYSSVKSHVHLVSPLHFAAYVNQSQIVSQMINFGAEVNAQDKDLWTPLHYGAFVGNNAIVASLLKAGAAFLADHHGRTPLHIATIKGYVHVVEALAAEPACPLFHKDSRGGDALAYAVNNRDTAVASALEKAKTRRSESRRKRRERKRRRKKQSKIPAANEAGKL